MNGQKVAIHIFVWYTFNMKRSELIDKLIKNVGSGKANIIE